MNAFTRNILFSLLSILCFFLLCEIAVRCFNPPLQLFRRGDNLSMFEDSPLYFWRLRPHFKGGHQNVLVPHAKTPAIPVRINSFGLRGPEIISTKKPDRYRIVVMGDSTTFGYGVQESDAYVSLLSQALPEAEIINAGVPGYSSFQGMLFWQNQVRSLHPDLLILAYAGINDIQQNRDKTDAQLWQDFSAALALKKILFHSHFYLWLRKTLYEQGKKISPAEGIHGKTLRYRVPPSEYRQNLQQIATSAQENGVKTLFLSIPIKRMLHEKQEEVLRAPEEFDPKAFALCEQGLAAINKHQPQAALAPLHEALRIQANLALAHQLLALAYEEIGDKKQGNIHQQIAKTLPGISMGDYAAAMKSLAKNLQIPMVDALPFLQNASGMDLFLEAIHPNETGHAVIAKALLPSVMGYFPGSPSK